MRLAPDFVMASILDVADIIAKMADGFETAVMECVGQHKDDAVLAVSEQLYSGIDGDDDYLDPNYDNDPYFSSPESGRWFGNAKGYKEWKHNITPPAPGAKLGLSPRPDNIPNLWIDGTFHSTIEAQATSDTLTITTRGAESLGIVSKFGEQILRLSSRGVGYLNDEYVEDGIAQFFSRCGW